MVLCTFPPYENILTFWYIEYHIITCMSNLTFWYIEYHIITCMSNLS